MLELYGIIGALALVLGLVIWFWIKDHRRQKDRVVKAETRAAAAEANEAKARENIEAVLDYEKQDSFLVKQREKHVETLVKTRSKGVAENEVKDLMVNLRDAYNSL